MPPNQSALKAWLSSWRGVGLVIGGMMRQGFEVNLSAGPDGWWATFLTERSVGGAPSIAGTSHAATPWWAVQRAAWRALNPRSSY